jgi:hypothetical protein
MIPQHKYTHSVSVFNLGDTHRGNHCFNQSFWRKTIRHIADDPDAIWVSTGDLLEVALKSSVSSVYESQTVQWEMDAIAEELQPIKHKCLGFVASNHHNRTDKETGISLDRMVAAQVGIQFLGISGLLNITIGRCSYYLHLHHGSGGGGSEGNKVNRALKVASNCQGADVYLSGHTHTYSHTPFLQRVIDRKRGITRDILSHSVVTGHCLDWVGSYAEKAAMKPAPLGFSVVTLEGTGQSPGLERAKKITPWFYTG